MNETERAPREARPARRQTTFLSGREILTRASELLLDSRATLRRALPDDPRSQMLCSSVESLLSDLAATIGQFEAGASSSLLEAWTQYTVELPPVLEARVPTGDPEQAVEWTRSLAHGVATLFGEMASSTSNEGLQEVYASLGSLVEAYERRLVSLERDLRDL